MIVQELNRARCIRVQPICTVANRESFNITLLSRTWSWKSMESRQMPTASICAANRQLLFFRFARTGCQCTSKDRCMRCHVAPALIQEIIINFHIVWKNMVDEMRLHVTLHRNKARSRFRGSIGVDCTNGDPKRVFHVSCKKSIYQDVESLPRFYNNDNTVIYASCVNLVHSFIYFNENRKGRTQGRLFPMRSRPGCQNSRFYHLAPVWGGFNTSLTFDAGLINT